MKIVASNQLDEHLIRSLIEQEAKIDLFGVGTELVVGRPEAALDGVYKLSEAGAKPRMKASETVAKSTFPGRKAVTRFYDGDGRITADAIHFADEAPPQRMIHPFESDRSLDLGACTGRPLLEPVVENGRRTQAPVPIEAARENLRGNLEALPREFRRFENPHTYKVGLSPGLHALRDRLLEEKRKEILS